MKATSHILGHEIIWRDDSWYYLDGVEADDKNIRPCVRCGKYPTEEGHDQCIANLPGVKNACCGHGVHEGYIQFEDGRIIRGNFKAVEK